MNPAVICISSWYGMNASFAAMIAGRYFVTIRRVGVPVPVGAIGESENVSQVFHLDDRFCAANSP
jgi:hypothetical protein